MTLAGADVGRTNTELFQNIATSIPGCRKLVPRVHIDSRGGFVKTFHFDTFRSMGLETEFVEQYYSSSHSGVLRGLHFQLPPHDHAKVVFCLSGHVIDVVLDLRKDSPAYGQYEMFDLEAKAGTMIYMPKGVAHGFYAVTDAILVYNVTTVHSPQHDAGIRWDSACIPWPNLRPQLSERDRLLPSLEDFESPFRLSSLTV